MGEGDRKVAPLLCAMCMPPVDINRVSRGMKMKSYRLCVGVLPAVVAVLISGQAKANPVDPVTILVIAEYGVEAIKLLSNIPTYSATSGGTASSSLVDATGSPATTLSVDRLFKGAAYASSSVDVNSHIFGSVADASALASWTTTFVVTELAACRTISRVK